MEVKSMILIIKRAPVLLFCADNTTINPQVYIDSVSRRGYIYCSEEYFSCRSAV